MLGNVSVEPEKSWLGWFFRGVFALGFIVILGRLFELQVIKGAYYRDLADGNRSREITIKAPRGKILANDGTPIVDNELIDKKLSFDLLKGYEKVIIDNASDSAEVITEPKRFYPFKDIIAQITGYLGEINQEELGKVNQNCREKGIRKLGDEIGRSGIESYYDCELRGINGLEIIEVDTLGVKTRTLGRRTAIAGTDIKTTIDLNIQKKAYESIKDKNGAVIVSKPNGEILALVSSPSYDPNIFVDSTDREKELSDLLTNKNLPLFNRAIAGTYHPGSLFKIVTSLAGFEAGAIATDYRYVDTGIVSVDDYEYTNWYFTQYGGTEGEVNTVKALARSTDTFYYEIGRKMGVNNIVEWAKKFGLNNKTGIDLPNEALGLLPTPEWKKAIKGEKWFLGNTFHLSIGQGDLTTTPASIHRVFMVMANDGKLCELFITLGKGVRCENLNINGEYMDIVKEGLKQACDPGGTGVPFFDFSPEVGCKTGTAETFEENVTHAWFSVFGPLEKPEVVITVLVEKGGGGSDVAAPIAREIMDYIFNP